MRAFYGEAGQVVLRDVAEPSAGPGELLVRVRAAGLNAADRYVLAGTHVAGPSVRAPEVPDVPAPTPLGSEAAGEVLAVGDGITVWKPGDRVMGTGAGAFAELTTLRDGMCFRVPANLSWTEAAAVPITFVSAHDALTLAGGLAPGATVLINAASSGVGVAALQLARLLFAQTVVASSTSQAKLDRLGAGGLPFDAGVVAGQSDYVERCLAATDGHGFDVILDSVGASALRDNVATAAIGGRIVSIGRIGGGHGEVNLDELSRKRVSLVGTTFRSRTLAMLTAAYAAAGAVMLPALADGRIRPVVDRVFPFADAAEAERYLLSAAHVGKVVLDVS